MLTQSLSGDFPLKNVGTPYRSIRWMPAWSDDRRLMAEAILRLMIEQGLRVKEVSQDQVG
jgi:hypothetical protein